MDLWSLFLNLFHFILLSTFLKDVFGEDKQHFRNFVGEMPKRGKYLGFEELNPIDTAGLLFANLHAGDRVAITGRRAQTVHAYVDALRQRNISVRLIQDQSDVNDFCFLQSAQRELVGSARSTFAAWSGLLSAKKSLSVRLYSINSTATRAQLGKEGWLLGYNWTHPALRERFLYQGYEQP